MRKPKLDLRITATRYINNNINSDFFQEGTKKFCEK